MGWSTEDGAHEVYALPEFADGQRGTGTSGGGVPDDQVIVDVEYVGRPGAITSTNYTTRPAAEIIGWRVACDCRDPGDGTMVNQWTSDDLIVRVPSKTLEDLHAGRVFAPDRDVPHVDDREDLAALIRQRWRSEHVNALDALGRIRDAKARIVAAEDDLEAAVADARTAGQSWDAIGRAAGVSRQSVHARWSLTQGDRRARAGRPSRPARP